MAIVRTAVPHFAEGIASPDIAVMAAGASTSNTISDARAKLGNFAKVEPTVSLGAGVYITSSYVSAAGTITVVFTNTSGGSLTPGVKALRYIVF